MLRLAVKKIYSVSHMLGSRTSSSYSVQQSSEVVTGLEEQKLNYSISYSVEITVS